MVLSKNREVQEPQVPAGVWGSAPHVTQTPCARRRIKNRAMYARSADELNPPHGFEKKPGGAGTSGSCRGIRGRAPNVAPEPARPQAHKNRAMFARSADELITPHGAVLRYLPAAWHSRPPSAPCAEKIILPLLDSVYMRSSQSSQPNSDTPDMNSRKER